MRSTLNALTTELKRLKAAGVKMVPVSDATLAQLRAVVNARGARAAESSQPLEKESAKAPLAPAPPPVSPPIAAAPAYEAPAREFKAKPLVANVAAIPAPQPFVLPEGDKATRWAALRDRVLDDLVCRAHVRPGKQVVFGVGSLEAKIMFVGEAPGAEEEVQGEPFVGPAGQLLTRMIGGMGLKRSDVYIGNIMNWRPEMALDPGGTQYGNRPPTEEEMAYCLPYLKAQIEIVNPALLVALGSTATQGLLGAGSFKTLGEVRGKWKEFSDRPLMVTYHPSYILRNQSNRSKRMIWEDLLKVMERAELPISEKQRGFFLDRA
ncbi:MAG: phage polymerase-related protein [Verrucomicrobia bacterium]|nr:phage polymerase-related protein [Verrucomicrobiota bacterium]